MKGIEPDCLAYTYGISFRPEINNGQTVTVICRLVEDREWSKDMLPVWETDGEFTLSATTGNQKWTPYQTNCLPEANLMRIDGHQKDAFDRETEILDNSTDDWITEVVFTPDMDGLK